MSEIMNDYDAGYADGVRNERQVEIMDTNKEIEILEGLLNDEAKLSAILQDGLETIVEVTGDDKYSGDTAIGIAQETLEAIAHYKKGNSKVSSIKNLRKIL